MNKPNYYCEYCGRKFDSVRTLTGLYCTRHPNGANRGKHKFYEGSEKSEYLCKYCGKQFRTIQEMVGVACTRHPKGSIKGNHSPAL